MWTVTKTLVPLDLPFGRLTATNELGHELNIELPTDLLRTIQVGEKLILTLERAV